MSYILGALQKADRERRKKQGLSLDSLSEVSAEATQSSGQGHRLVVPGLISGVAIVIAAVLVWKPGSASPEGEAIVVTSQAPASLTTTRPTPQPLVPAAELSLPAELPIEGIVFVEDRPAQARVFIQGQGYRAGDSYRGLQINSINAVSVTLSNGTSTQTYPIP